MSSKQSDYENSRCKQDLIGRRCECINLGMIITGVIEAVNDTQYTAEVKVRYDKPQQWGQEILYSGWSQGDKEDESGSLQYVRLLPNLLPRLTKH